MKILRWPILLISAVFFTGCAAKYPTAKEWNSYPPVWQQDKVEKSIQGNFNDVKTFLLSAAKLKDGMTIDTVRRLGFNADLPQKSCEKVGWLEASNAILQNTNLAAASIHDAIREKRQYSGIRCKAVDTKSRKDRIYFSNKDTFKNGVEINLTVVFKNDSLIAVNLNKNTIRESERQKAFGQILTDVMRLDIPIRP